jgi:hypothetical protein
MFLRHAVMERNDAVAQGSSKRPRVQPISLSGLVSPLTLPTDGSAGRSSATSSSSGQSASSVFTSPPSSSRSNVNNADRATFRNNARKIGKNEARRRAAKEANVIVPLQATNLENNATGLGAGGGSAIVRAHRNGRSVAKLIIQEEPDDCERAMVEAERQNEARRVLVKQLPALLNLADTMSLPLTVPAVKQYGSIPIRYEQHDFHCHLVMDRLTPPLQGTELIHPVFYPDDRPLDRSFGRKIQADVDPRSNPSRGFFASPVWLQEHVFAESGRASVGGAWKENLQGGSLSSVDDVAWAIGLAYGALVFGADLLPDDVEYVLARQDRRLVLGVIDFGLARPLSFDSRDDATIKALAMEINGCYGSDIYFPQAGTQAFPAFWTGFERAFDAFVRDPSSVKFAVMEQLRAWNVR